jgi:2-polyprenyl-3-methyl-5-hydroxy-6-metoxy-1,4-benzoquinol methylase
MFGLSAVKEQAVQRTCPGCDGRDAAPVFQLAGGAHSVERCVACGLAFLWPPASGAALEALYGAYYRADNVALHPITAARYHRILGRLEASRGPGRLLDVGCGAGQFLEVARARGWTAEGTEISSSAAPFLESRGVTVHRGELPDIALGSVYDAVTLLEVLEHVRRPQAYLEAACRLLRPGGLLYLTTPNFDGLSRRLLGERWRVMAPEHLAYYSPGALRHGLARAGFADVHVRTKNLDVVDLSHKLVSRRQPPPGHSNITETTALREKLEGRTGYAWAKALANRVLALSGTGDTLEAYAGRGPR